MVTVTDPPPPGTTADPLLLVTPVFTVTCSVAPPHAAGRTPTVTLLTVLAVRFWSTERPALVHRGVAAVAAPREPDARLSDAAAPTTAPVAVTRITTSTLRNMVIWRCPLR
jgi:hypothetical protein